MACPLEVRPERRMVEDLAVVDDCNRAILVEHRLVAGSGYIDDAQATMAEKHRPGFEDTSIIGPAMRYSAGHFDEDGLTVPRFTYVDESRYSAHTG
jgi:hypothetical protein